MYADEKSPGEAKVGTPSLAGFVAWLETKDPHEWYDLYISRECAYGQFYRDLGRSYEVSFSSIGPDLGLTRMQAHDVVHGEGRHEWTYGAALKRARTLLTNQGAS